MHNMKRQIRNYMFLDNSLAFIPNLVAIDVVAQPLNFLIQQKIQQKYLTKKRKELAHLGKKRRFLK